MAQEPITDPLPPPHRPAADTVRIRRLPIAILLMCAALVPLLSLSSCQLPGASTSAVPATSNVTYALPTWWRPCLRYAANQGHICAQWDMTKAPVTCDGSNYQRNTGSQAVLLTTWRGLQVCGPLPDHVSTSDNYVVFTPNGSVEQEFECTELVKRYLFLAYGLPSIGGTNGNGVVDAYTRQPGSPFHRIVNDAADNGQLRLFPAVGDVLSYATVHTSIVTGVSITDRAQGDARIKVIEENRSPTGEETLHMSHWIIDQQVSAWMTPRSVAGQNGSPQASPAPLPSAVYFGSDDGNIYKLRATDGKLLWRYQTGGKVNSSPTLFNGMLIVGSGDNYVYAFSVSDGSVLWRFRGGGAFHGSPVIAGGVVYIGSDDGSMYALRALDGKQLWRFTTGSFVEGLPAVSNGVIYVSSDDNSISALRVSDGSVLWRYFTQGPVHSCVVRDGVVYAGSLDGNIYAIRASDGSELWHYPTGPIGGLVAIDNNTAFVSSDDGYLYALHIGSGSLAWRTYTGGHGHGPVIADGVIYVGSFDEHVYALRANDGSILWRYPTHGIVSPQPVILGGIVYVGSWDDSLYALRAVDGARLWSFQAAGVIDDQPCIQ